MDYLVTYEDELGLQHHGILGQKWGHREGPPYPLDSEDHSASEKKAGWRKSLDRDEKKTQKSLNKLNKFISSEEDKLKGDPSQYTKKELADHSENLKKIKDWANTVDVSKISSKDIAQARMFYKRNQSRYIDTLTGNKTPKATTRTTESNRSKDATNVKKKTKKRTDTLSDYDPIAELNKSMKNTIDKTRVEYGKMALREWMKS